MGWGGGGGGLWRQAHLGSPHPLAHGNGLSKVLCPLATSFAPIHPFSSTELGGGTRSTPAFLSPSHHPHPPIPPPLKKSLPRLKKPHSPWLLFLANLRLLCLSSPSSLPPLHLPPSLSLGGKKVIAQMISQSSVAVATGCWNWDRRAARTTERSSISQGWGSPAFVFASLSRGARRCEAPSSAPCVGPFRRQPPTARLQFIKLLVSRCHRGVGRALAFVSWCGGTVLCQRCPLCQEGGSCPWRSGCGAGAHHGFLPAAVTKPGGTHAAGVQGSLSSCNIPHVKYEAKFLLILHEEPGVNCVLPISSSRALQSLFLPPPSSFKQRRFQIFLSSLP